ncbi:hypothetical protein ACMA1D_30640 [Streptomyces sp. 796.1]|uniref:hypothetical protein n=1 Tax=Streptomyces sp. 796.1 TaxID=3163029 RepID=UPI0039C906D9
MFEAAPTAIPLPTPAAYAPTAYALNGAAAERDRGERVPAPAPRTGRDARRPRIDRGAPARQAPRVLRNIPRRHGY